MLCLDGIKWEKKENLEVYELFIWIKIKGKKF